MRRKIRLSTRNRAGEFKFTFDTPKKAVDFVKGWLEHPEVPYTLTISE